MTRHLAAALFLATVSTAHASPSRHSPESHFLASNPHVPLAVVSGGVIRNAVAPTTRGASCGPAKRWAAIGSEWRGLDAWGQFTDGTFTVSSAETYDVTGCAEVSFSPTPKADATTLFVSKDSSFRPTPSVRWQPSAHEKANFLTLLTNLPTSKAVSTALRCKEVPEEAMFFELHGAGSAPRRYAVGGTVGGYVIASLQTTWTTEFVYKSTAPDLCFRPLAVFDMNGDGIPEVVMREAESTSWADFVLKRGTATEWTRAAQSRGGSTA